MSASPELRDIKKMEKTDFSQTCNRLSQYLKENKASFGDLSFTSNCDSGKSPAMNLFPTHTGFGNFGSSSSDGLSQIQDPSNKAAAKQMTIIYGGKVVVFDEVSAEKVKEVLMLANHASLQNKTVMRSNSFVEHVRHPIFANNSSPPQTRNASLRSFLEKRKDRIKARAPYAAATTTDTKPDETKAWLGLGTPSA